LVSAWPALQVTWQFERASAVKPSAQVSQRVALLSWQIRQFLALQAWTMQDPPERAQPRLHWVQEEGVLHSLQLLMALEQE
jgi:hypothetical protein